MTEQGVIAAAEREPVAARRAGAQEFPAEIHNRPDWWFVLLLWVAIYLPGLGQVEFRLEEPHRVEPALTMLDSGNWSQPMIGGEPYYSKPPLINWLIAAAFWCAGGVSETAARLPSTLSILALSLVGLRTVREWAGRGIALGTAVVTLGSAALLDKGRLCEIEACYTALSGVALLIWLQGWLRNRVSILRWVLIGTLLGIAVLGKGVAHIFFFYAFVLVLSLAEKRNRELMSWGHLASLFFMIVLPALWLWQMRHAAADASSAWKTEMVGRFMKSGEGVHWRESLIGPFSSAANLLPWTLLLVMRPWRTHRCPLTPAMPALGRLLERFCFLTLIILPLIPAYRPRYSMPLYALAMVTLAWWGQTVEASSRTGRVWTVIMRVIAALSLPAAMTSVWINRGQWLWTILAVIGAALGLFVWKRSRGFLEPLARWRHSALAISALALSAWGVATPLLAKEAPRHEAAARIGSHLGANEKFIALKPGHLPYLIYLHGRYTVAEKASQLPPGPVKVLTPKHLVSSWRFAGRSKQVLDEVGNGSRTAVLLELGARK